METSLFARNRFEARVVRLHPSGCGFIAGEDRHAVFVPSALCRTAPRIGWMVRGTKEPSRVKGYGKACWTATAVQSISAPLKLYAEDIAPCPPTARVQEGAMPAPREARPSQPPARPPHEPSPPTQAPPEPSLVDAP